MAREARREAHRPARRSAQPGGLRAVGAREAATQRSRAASDAELNELLREALAPLALFGARAFAREGVAYLVGAVATSRQRQRAEELAGQVAGVRRVVNELSVEPAAADRLPREAELEPVSEPGVGADSPELVRGSEFDLNEPIGTNDPAEATEQGEPYYPPTDPVVRTAPRLKGDITYLGGFARGADEDIEIEHHPRRLAGGDDEIAEQVRLALAEDAFTADLSIWVAVRRGVVHLRGRVGSLDEAEQVEAVAGQVPGVVEVRDELEVEGL